MKKASYRCSGFRACRFGQRSRTNKGHQQRRLRARLRDLRGFGGVFPQVFAATTNGSFGTQTFGISSETLGCSPKGRVDIPDRRTVEFIGPNLNRLAQDMSRGEGETLAALADTMQIAPNDRGAFYTATQNNFRRIIQGDSVTAGEVALSL